MSIENLYEEQQREEAGTCSAISAMIYPKQHDLGGFFVRRALPTGKHRKVGPWVFFDHIGPAHFNPGTGVDVRPHPHINLATVTYLFEGEMLHRDSLGNERVIKPGEINLMVAGKGIVHSERQREEIKKSNNNKLSGLQLWLALPEQDEEISPEFHHYDKNEIPSLIINQVPVRVLIGEAYGVKSPVKTFAKTIYVEAHLKAGQKLMLPDGADERALYVVSGKLKAKESVLETFCMAILDCEKNIVVEAVEDTQLALVGGEKLSHRYIWWNFVSSRKERIEQGKLDWKNKKFPKVPGDEKDFIPLP